LFEYGSDQAIIANLQALRAGGSGVRLIAGSATCAESARLSHQVLLRPV
jgi:hypothetical protein